MKIFLILFNFRDSNGLSKTNQQNLATLFFFMRMMCTEKNLGLFVNLIESELNSFEILPVRKSNACSGLAKVFCKVSPEANISIGKVWHMRRSQTTDFSDYAQTCSTPCQNSVATMPRLAARLGFFVAKFSRLYPDLQLDFVFISLKFHDYAQTCRQTLNFSRQIFATMPSLAARHCFYPTKISRLLPDLQPDFDFSRKISATMPRLAARLCFYLTKISRLFPDLQPDFDFFLQNCRDCTQTCSQTLFLSH